MVAFTFNEIFDGREFCTYGHYVENELFFIGAGPIARAFDFGFGKHNELWHEYRQALNVTVTIFERYRTRAEAVVAARLLVAQHRPYANRTAKDQTNAAVFDRGMREHTIIVCDPGGHEFASIADAVAATGISQGAISNSISGRYPTVRGLTFRRISRRPLAAPFQTDV